MADGFSFEEAQGTGTQSKKPVGFSFEEAMGKPAAETGFFGNIGNLLVQGGKQALAAAEVSPSVLAGNVGQNKAALLAKQLAEPDKPQPPELQEIKGAFKDEAQGFEKAQGFLESAKAFGPVLVEIGKQALTNPKGLAYMTAEQAANMAPSVAGMIAGGRTGAMVGAAVPLPGAAPIGTAVGAAVGAFSGSVPMEVGSEFIGLVGKELAARQLPATEENIAALLRDTDFMATATKNATTKGVTTAGVDAAMSAVTGGLASAPRRAAVKAATAELGAAADAAKIAGRTKSLLAQRTLGQKIGTGAGAVGAEVVGGGLSEAAGQKAAYGKVDIEDVAQEMLGGLGGSAIEVPAAAYSMTRDLATGKPTTVVSSTPTAQTVPAEPTETPIQKQIAEKTGITETPPAPPSMLSSEEAAAQRLPMLQAKVEEDMAAQEERARREGPRPVVPEVAPVETSRFDTEPAPVATREELLAKQADIDRMRLEAGLPTGESSLTPGVQPEVTAPTEVLTPKIVDNRPLQEGAAKNRLMVMQNMLKNEGGDPASLTIVPHPTAENRFAIQSLDVPARFTPEIQGNKNETGRVRETTVTRTDETGKPYTETTETPAGPGIEIDPIKTYIDIARRTNTPASMRLVRDFESGLVTRDDVQAALDAEKLAGRPLPLNYTQAGEPWFLAPETFKPRGERELPPSSRLTREIPQGPTRPGEIIPPQEPPPQEPPTPPEEEPPEPTGTTPQTLDEFKQKFPIDSDQPQVREAHVNGNFRQLADVMASSKNPAVKRIGELSRAIAGKVKLLPPGKQPKNVLGRYRYVDDSIQMAPKAAGSEWVSAHESVHALIALAQRTPTARQVPIVADINKLFLHVKRELNRQGKGRGRKYSQQVYGLANELEFTAEAMSNPEFQYMLMQIPYAGKRSAWTEFTRLVANLLGIKNTNALTEVMNLTDKLAQTPRPKYVFNKDMTSENAGEVTEIPEEQALSMPSFGKKPTPLTPTDVGKQAMDIVSQTGMEAKPPPETQMQLAKKALAKAKEDPALTAKTAKAALQRAMDKFETSMFSGDAAFNNEIRRNLMQDFQDNPEVLGLLLEASQSQTVHSDALATQFIVDGGIAYDKETNKWVSVKKEDNFIKLAKDIEALQKKYNLTKEDAERIAHTYFVAKRFKSLQNKQTEREAEIAQLEDRINKEQNNRKLTDSQRDSIVKGLRSDIKKLKADKVYISPEQQAMIKPGTSLGSLMPELEKISDTWQGIRVNAIKAMVDGGLWNFKMAEAMLDNIDYVPFYREDQLEESQGPQKFIKGLEVKAKEYKLKGSASAVNDVFDNMVRWTQYAINRSVRNHKALQMVDLATEINLGDEKMAKQVEEMDKDKNIVRVFRDGVQELYEVADPLYMDAFTAISNVAMPNIRFFSFMADLLRKTVVLNPLFSLAQVPADAFSAMFSSGLKTPYALSIPARAAKEFVTTLIKSSATHNLLKQYGAVGVRDFNATIARQDVEIAAGLKAPKGFKGNIMEGLSHIAMSADNAVRQAVYEAAMAQGLSKSEAIEKAFEIINFRRRGTNKTVNVLGQTVPFFYAYMSVQRVAMKTLSLTGISPQSRGEALKTLAYTSAAVMALSMLYTMANGGDEEYEKTPTAVRDRTLHVPGTSMRIPLRPDFFLFPKIVAEHLYHLITDKGLTDGAKFRKSLAETLGSAILSPQPIPQAIKPIFEAGINHDFFQGRPIVGEFEQKKEAERQFNDNTSELSKILSHVPLSYSAQRNQFEGISPIVLDHVIRGMFGSLGGLTLYASNFMLHSDPNVERPTLAFRDVMAGLPGTSGFITRANESRLKNDFYELRDVVEKANATYKDIEKRSPQGIDDFLKDEKNLMRLGLVKDVESITRELSGIRNAVTQISNAPKDMFTGEQKEIRIKELRDLEAQMMKSIPINKLREMAKM